MYVPWTQRGDGWEYHKTEGLGKKDFKAKRYDYLLAGAQQRGQELVPPCAAAQSGYHSLLSLLRAQTSIACV